MPTSVTRKTFGEELMRVLSPLGMAASFEAIERRRSADDHRRQALTLQLQQVEFEARRAFEQYNEVDARNRLVAAELERRWNEKLEEVERLKSTLAEFDAYAGDLTDDDRELVLALGERFDLVWRSDDCPIELKKKILRTVIEEAVVDLDDETRTLRFVIHWKGAAHSQFEMQKPNSGAEQQTDEGDLDIIRTMAESGHGDKVIAYVLAKLGRRTGKGNKWSQLSVATARRNHKIPGQKQSKLDPDVLSMGQAARYSGVSSLTIRRLVAHGLLSMRQTFPWAPWEIRRSDLDAEPVRDMLDRLRKTGKLHFEGSVSANQLPLSL